MAQTSTDRPAIVRHGIAAMTCAAHVLLAAMSLAASDNACRIEVVEKGSGWPVPLVELRTVSGIRLVTDNAGVIACDAPELMGRETWFHVRGQGYGVEADGFGYEGVRLTPRAGQSVRVEVARRIVAKRIGRMTGSGLFAETEKLGGKPGVSESGIVGCDSVQTAVHLGKRYWIWGDSNLAHYPLGIFHASGATSAIGPLKSLEPPLALDLDYFRDELHRPRAVANLPGRGPTWLSGLASLDDARGRAHLVASYAKIEPPLAAWQRGLCEWNEKTKRFEVTRVIWEAGPDAKDAKAEPRMPDGHAAAWTDDRGRKWILMSNPFPTLKFRANYEAWNDPSSWDTINASGALTTPDGEKVVPHSGSVTWNPFRQRWVTIFMERFGKPSAFGEIWYAEADSPLGPWGVAVKVLSHRNYSFYNPEIHAGFTPEHSPHLFFEGTYTVLFAGPSKSESLAPDYPQPTPRYEYNQILYRLDLDDPALEPARGKAAHGVSHVGESLRDSQNVRRP